MIARSRRFNKSTPSSSRSLAPLEMQHGKTEGAYFVYKTGEPATQRLDQKVSERKLQAIFRILILRDEDFVWQAKVQTVLICIEIANLTTYTIKSLLKQTKIW